MKRLKYFLFVFSLLCSVVGLSQVVDTHKTKDVMTNEGEEIDSVKNVNAIKGEKKHVSDDFKSDENKKILRLGSRFLFGVATSYADSVTYVSNIVEIVGMDGRIQEKTPVGIDLYTQDLRDFLKERGKTGYLCATYVCKSRKEAEQKILDVRNNVLRNKLTALQPISEFKYKYISTEHIYSNEEKPNESQNDDF